MISLQNVSKTFGSRQNSVRALNGVSLQIEKGQIFGLIGHNGAGKTTLIKMICGLIEPTDGHISIDGLEVNKNRRVTMRNLGVVLEGTRNIYWRLNAIQNLKYFAGLKGLTGGIVAQRSEQLLKDLSLWELRSTKSASLSRGMQQKLAIACAFIGAPGVLLLDEPTLGLDMESAITVKEWLTRMTESEGRTVILTTHQLDVAQQLCKNVGILRRGELVHESALSLVFDATKPAAVEVTIDRQHQEHQAPLTGWEVVRREAGSITLRSTQHRVRPLEAVASELTAKNLRPLSIRYVQPTLQDIYMATGESET